MSYFVILTNQNPKVLFYFDLDLGSPPVASSGYYCISLSTETFSYLMSF